jgi:hypothetical protein
MRDDPERKRKPQSGTRAVVVENSEYENSCGAALEW